MPPFIMLLLLALLASLPARASAQSDPVLASRAAYQQAVHAYEAHDFPAFLRHAREAERLRPEHGGVVYGLACAYALTGDTAGGPCHASALRRARPHGRPRRRRRLHHTPRPARLRQPARRRCGRNAAPLVRSTPAFTLAERDLLTEGIAYDLEDPVVLRRQRPSSGRSCGWTAADAPRSSCPRG